MTKEQAEGSTSLNGLGKLEKMDWNEIKESFDNIKKLSTHGMVIVNVSLLDEQLEALLTAYFIDKPKAVNELLDDPGCLSTFGARIKLSFVLGLISAKEFDMLNLIRKIRNDFAHNSRATSFSQSPIKDRCLALDVTKFPTSGEQCDPKNPQEKFIASYGFLLLSIIHRREHLNHREETKSITEDELYSRIKEHEAKSEK